MPARDLVDRQSLTAPMLEFLRGAVGSRLNILVSGGTGAGMFADIAVFDPETIEDRATFEKPHQFAVGMRHVFVNGGHVLKDGEHTGARPGRAVYGPGKKH